MFVNITLWTSDADLIVFCLLNSCACLAMSAFILIRCSLTLTLVPFSFCPCLSSCYKVVSKKVVVVGKVVLALEISYFLLQLHLHMICVWFPTRCHDCHWFWSIVPAYKLEDILTVSVTSTTVINSTPHTQTFFPWQKMWELGECDFHCLTSSPLYL